MLINDVRFSPAGILAPKSNADLAFVMHCLSYLSTNGTAAILCFPGVLYRGNAEQKIRKYLVDNDFIDSIIHLPADLFFGTKISTVILVLKRNKKENKIFFIDASKEFIHYGAKNKLTAENISTILKVLTERKNIKHFSKLVSYKEIAANNFDLSTSKYVEQKDDKEHIDIKQLNSEIDQIVSRQNKLRKDINEIINSLEG